jgi:catechol 2,3-dioxygenase-like lactoylglutathione lyase family enzyme
MQTVSIRYLVDDVVAALDFYTRHLGFSVELNAAPAFAAVTLGPLRLLLSGPGSSGALPMPDGRKPMPGGWTRFQLPVKDLEREVARLRAAGLPFRNEIVEGRGGFQILLEDPSGNPIELWQAAAAP